MDFEGDHTIGLPIKRGGSVMSFQISQAIKGVIAISVLVGIVSPARANIRQQRDRVQRYCMVSLSGVQDVSLRRWCLKQSARMP
jgi:hypothetical protein